jgi:hypothetical protein
LPLLLDRDRNERLTGYVQEIRQNVLIDVLMCLMFVGAPSLVWPVTVRPR